MEKKMLEKTELVSRTEGRKGREEGGEGRGGRK